MSDYRNDPMRRDEPYDLNTRNNNGPWGWIAGAVLLAILAALAFGIGYTPNQSGTNRVASNAPITQPAPAPSGPGSTTFAPAPTNPAPVNPAPPQAKP